MIALVPVVVEQCVAPEAPTARTAETFVKLKGAPRDVESLLSAKLPAGWEIKADVTRSNRRSVSIYVGRQAKYRDIGGFIYSAQAKRLEVAVVTNPPICGMDQ
ncbi:hypothetical protein [Sphingomonas yantingensis]|uniref:Uncharacterized protein n=1 Tax=Sphingomonas yantingensis TaxID=1241761 RepID=A0A7W9AS62_9SPHN|nr:hypothetical protein [Sphingomonas yantingensis]MBB5699578.1 hypothetical protein [Sphingomonas yantingensis]